MLHLLEIRSRNRLTTSSHRSRSVIEISLLCGRCPHVSLLFKGRIILRCRVILLLGNFSSSVCRTVETLLCCRTQYYLVGLCRSFLRLICVNSRHDKSSLKNSFICVYLFLCLFLLTLLSGSSIVCRCLLF